MANGSIPANAPEFPIAESTTIATYSVLLVWSLFGNVLVIAVILTYKRLKTNLNYLIVNMAVADLFIPLLNFPVAIYQIHHPNWAIGGELGNALCKLLALSLHISPFVSALSCVTIATERLVLIVYPMLKSMLFSGKRIAVLIAFTWIASTAFISPQFSMIGVQVNQNGLLKCGIIDMEAYDSYAIFLVVVLFCVPFVLITVIYAIMLYNLLKASKNVSNIINNEQMLTRQRRNKKILYMSIAVIVAFFVLCGPYYILLFIIAFLPKTTLQQNMNKNELFIAIFICQCLAFANAAVNPCIYFTFLGSYRDGARQIFRKKSNSSNGEGQVEMSRLRSISTTARKDNRNSTECN